MPTPDPQRSPFWSTDPAELLASLGSSPTGLSSAEAALRMERAHRRRLQARQPSAWWLAWSQLKSPLVLMLVVAAALAFVVGEVTDALVILCIVLIGSALGFYQEHGANLALARLRSLVDARTRVLRDGVERAIPIDGVVPGDVVLLDAGTLVPADCRLLTESDLHVDEATLTGETFPVEKEVASVPGDAPLSARRCALFLGTHVVTGLATAMVVQVGRDTEVGRIARSLERPGEPCDLEQGVERFGLMIARLTAILASTLLVLNIALGRPMIDSLLYSLALAVGLVPELLPVIVSVNLARGARRMAEARVIVRRLSAMEDFGSIDVLCSDKTGTLTEGKVRLHSAIDASGAPSEAVRRAAVLNGSFESGFANPIDIALRQETVDRQGVRKLDEAPYDFVRKRMSVLVDDGGTICLITKGAASTVLDVCRDVREPDGRTVPLPERRPALEAMVQALSRDGLRCLSVAMRTFDQRRPITRADEQNLTFLGFVAFADTPKAGIGQTLDSLERLGIRLKMVTGDSRDVAVAVARQIGLPAPRVMTGRDLNETSDRALPLRAHDTDVFAEVEPSQKERIVVALRRAGHVVGYLGDGINDAPALHAAHVGISIDTAVDVAREAAHIVLLEKDLAVLVDGVRLGRSTLANTLKYVYITSSANFGNMLSMAVASFFLPFLPLLPKQILLVNLLSDLPMMALATDLVDEEQLDRGRRWDARAIRRFMLLFGAVSSVFDIATFVMLSQLLAGEAEFHSAWFVESLVTELVVLWVMRTQRPFWRSPAAPALLGLTLATAAMGLALPFVDNPFALVPLTWPVMIGLTGVTAGYLVTSELAKRWFFSRQPATV